MILRREISGLHQYDRESGLHVLLDEVKIPADEAAKRGPRHLSVMLTRRCNLNCPFCYVDKSDRAAPLGFLMDVCNAATELQVLDVTLGGGEPTLYEAFPEFISYAWQNHTFGVSVTTNAVDISPLLEVAGMLSSVRVSTDERIRPLGGRLRGQIARLSEVHKVGANVLWSHGSSSWVRETIGDLASLGTRDFLLIPEHDHGRYLLSESDWQDLDDFVCNHSQDYQIMLTSDASARISMPILNTERDNEFLFAHIDESGNIRRRSWGPCVGRTTGVRQIVHGLQKLNPLRRDRHEDLV